MISRGNFCFFTLLIIANCLAVPTTRTNVKELDESSKYLIRVQDKTYYVETSIAVNWYEANNLCNYYGLKLASITTENENNAIRDHLTTAGLSSVTYWTSGNDLAKMQEYVWGSTGQKLNESFTDWAPGNPNHANRTDEIHGNMIERCLQIYYGRNLQWDDYFCELELSFICEF